MSKYLVFVEEAIQALGFVRPEAAEWLSQQMAKYSDGDVARLVRTMGTPLSPEERKKLKLGNLKMTKEAWEALTDLGKQDPARGLEFTVRRALANYERQREIYQIMHNPEVTDVEFSSWDPCDAVIKMGLNNKVMPKESIPEIPVPGCDKMVCQCRIHRHYRYDDDYDNEIVINIESKDYEVAAIPPPNNKKKRIWRKAFNIIRNILAVIGLIVLIVAIFGPAPS